MFKIVLLTGFNDSIEFGVIAGDDIEGFGVTRDLTKFAEFKTQADARREVKWWHNNPNCDRFNFDIQPV